MKFIEIQNDNPVLDNDGNYKYIENLIILYEEHQVTQEPLKI